MLIITCAEMNCRGVEMNNKYSMLIFLLFVSFFGCSRKGELCQKIEFEEGISVNLRRDMILAPIDGGRGPNGTAIGVLIKNQSIPDDLSANMVRLSLWPKYVGKNIVRCKSTKLLKDDVISCTEALKKNNIIMLAQYRNLGDEKKEGYGLISKRIAEVIESSMRSCQD